MGHKALIRGHLDLSPKYDELVCPRSRERTIFNHYFMLHHENYIKNALLEINIEHIHNRLGD